MVGMGDAPAVKQKYVIINDCDAPQPRMVCQWVPGVGYCYLDRRQNKSAYDGMYGDAATPMEAFGFICRDDPDGTVSFYLSGEQPTATYKDGQPRRWQSHATAFQRRRLTLSVVKEKMRTQPSVHYYLSGKKKP